MLSDKYLWPVPELTPVHKAYELASFQELVTGGEIVMVGMVGDEQGIKEGEEEVARDVGFEGEIKV
jgi:hypothetical protein